MPFLMPTRGITCQILFSFCNWLVVEAMSVLVQWLASATDCTIVWNVGSTQQAIASTCCVPGTCCSSKTTTVTFRSSVWTSLLPTMTSVKPRSLVTATESCVAVCFFSVLEHGSFYSADILRGSVATCLWYTVASLTRCCNDSESLQYCCCTDRSTVFTMWRQCAPPSFGPCKSATLKQHHNQLRHFLPALGHDQHTDNGTSRLA